MQYANVRIDIFQGHEHIAHYEQRNIPQDPIERYYANQFSGLNHIKFYDYASHMLLHDNIWHILLEKAFSILWPEKIDYLDEDGLQNFLRTALPPLSQ